MSSDGEACGIPEAGGEPGDRGLVGARGPAACRRWADYALGFSRISNIWIVSPIWRSLNEPRLMPHSKPSRTSVTSSLNRRSPAISRLSPMTVPSRRIRARPPRRISPLDDRPGDVAELARPEDLADLRLTEANLLELRLEHALERCLDLLDGLVDHRVVPDLHALAVGDVGVLALGPDVEPDDDRVRRHGEVDVVQRDRADTPVDDPQVDLVAYVDLEQSILQRFDRTRC